MALNDVRALPVYAEPPAATTPAERLRRGGGWWTLVLAMVMLLAMTESLVTADWSNWLEVVRLAVLGGALLAFALSLTRWGGVFPVIYGFIASLAWIILLFNQLIFPELPARAAFLELLRRNTDWIVALASGKASADNLIFVTQLALLGWWIGYLALWSLMRHQRVIYAVLPAGVALLVNVYYAAQNLTPYVILYLAAVLLLAIRVELARNELRWQMTRVRYAPDITIDFLKSGVAFTVLVIVLAWAMPDAADTFTMEKLLRPLEGPWQHVEDNWNRLYKSLNYSRSTAAVVSSFGKAMTLGGAVSLTARPIFEAETPQRTYWRAAAYDTYTGDGWLNTDTERVPIERDTALGEPAVSETKEITTTITPLEPGQLTIFGPPQPVRVGVPVNADATPLTGPDERLISMMQSRVKLDREGGRYSVVSSISDAPIDKLMADNTDYPSWIVGRYLQLPDSLPQRVRDLAAQVTHAQEDVYGKATAIESFLRTYAYNQQIDAPPAGRDAVDYFLFDGKEGYCDYYASAMVVMLRAVGVPARMVVGYTPGQPIRDPAEMNNPDLLMQGAAVMQPTKYRVEERNGHAWPEVYFPTYGWIQFEPTASEPLLARPVPPADPLEGGMTPEPPAGQPENLQEQQQPQTPAEVAPPETLLSQMGDWLADNWKWLTAMIVLLIAAIAGAIVARRREIAFFRDSEVLARLFVLLGLWAGRLHIPWQPSQTPLERAAQFNARLPEAAPAVDTIAGLFVAQQYGRQEPAPSTVASLADTWRGLQPRLWRQWLIGEIQGLRKEKKA
jgi:transglutaminase-like putative cysteine protease